MATIMYKDGVMHRINPLSVDAHLKSGFTLENKPAFNRDAVMSEIENLTGKKPHGKTSDEKLAELLEAARDEKD